MSGAPGDDPRTDRPGDGIAPTNGELAPAPDETRYADGTVPHGGDAPPGGDAPLGGDTGVGRVRARRRHPLLELPALVAIAFLIAVVIKTFLFQAFYIPSGSMEPGLLINDRVLVNKLVYRLHEPRRGDIVVFARDEDRSPRSFLQKVRGVLFEGLGVTRPGHTDFIKRVIALPGETVEITDGRVRITPPDGEPFELDEPYAQPDPGESFGPYVVPARSLFVMGDNRPSSSDSRSDLGPIDREEVIGRAFVRVWPPSRVGLLRRPRYDAAARAMLPAA